MAHDLAARGDIRRAVVATIAATVFLMAAVTEAWYAQAGLQPSLIVCGSMIGGMACWLATTWRRPAEPRLIVPVYLLTMGLFFVHVLEEYLFHFSDRIAAMFALDWSESQFVLTIMLLGPMVWLAAAIGLVRRNPFANFIAWFILFGMVIGEPAHLVFPIIEGGPYHYFPGMWTALLPMVTAIYGITLIVRDHRQAMRREAA